MDQGLKERLVGAAVLVAIAVWLIPWVLDGPEAPLETSAGSLTLPAAEEPMPMRTQTLRLGDDSPPSAESPAPAASEPPAESNAAAIQPPAAGNSVDEDETPPAEPIVAAARPEPERTAPAATPPPVTTPPSKPAAATGDWTVQLGSFGEEANARRVAQRSGTFGYKAEVSTLKSGGRTLYRVRVGVGRSRAEAEATVSALKAHGIDASVVAAR